MRFGVLNAVSNTETSFQTPFNTVFDNYAAEKAHENAKELPRLLELANMDSAVVYGPRDTRGPKKQPDLRLKLCIPKLPATP